MFRDYYNYEVFEDGKIWSKYSKKFLKPKTKKNGYQEVCLYDNDGKRDIQLVHRVCWIAVKGEIPEGMQINHKDECKTNNHIDNLELVTPKQNINYGTANKRRAQTLSKVLKGKLINHPDRSKRVGAFKDGELQIVFPSTNEAGRNGFLQGEVSACCRGKAKTHKGYTWKYLDGEEN